MWIVFLWLSYLAKSLIFILLYSYNPANVIKISKIIDVSIRPMHFDYCKNQKQPSAYQDFCIFLFLFSPHVSFGMKECNFSVTFFLDTSGISKHFFFLFIHIQCVSRCLIK